MSGAEANRKPAASEGKKPPRSLDELRRLVEQDPTANFELSATEFMMLTGSPQRDGFSSTPPSQAASLMGCDEPDDIRVIGCILDHTSRGGDGTRGRTPFARLADGSALKRPGIAAKLKLPPAKANAAIDTAIAKGRIREDVEGRFWLCGNVPAPKLKSDGQRKGVTLCTKSRPNYLLKRLQQLTEDDRNNFHKNQERLDAAENEAIAEATAQVREAFEPLHEQLLATVDLKPVKLKKRREDTPRKEPQLKITLQMKLPDFDFVQSRQDGFVQTPDPTSYEPASEFAQTENEFAQSGQPYRKSESESFRVSKSAPEPTPPPAGPPTHSETAKVQATLEELGFAVSASDQFLNDFVALASAHNIPLRSVLRAITDKVEEKRSKGSKVFNVGALRDFLRKDIATWIRQHGREIERDFKYEEREQRESEAEAVSDVGAQLKAAAAGRRI